jgi:hypothetical protein
MFGQRFHHRLLPQSITTTEEPIIRHRNSRKHGEVSSTYRNDCRAGTGTASRNCQAATGTRWSCMNRNCTC